MREARRLRWLSIRADTRRDGRPPCKAAYLRSIYVTDFGKFDPVAGPG